MSAREILLGSGRVARLPFFLYKVGLVLAAVVLVAVTVETNPATGTSETGGLTLAVLLFLMWLGLMNIRRRVHDTNAPIVTYAAIFFPGANIVAGLYLLLKEGDPDDNEHGPSPHTTSEPIAASERTLPSATSPV